MFYATILIMSIITLSNISIAEISKTQWTNINRLLLRGPILPTNARTCLENNIYKNYHKWATNYAIKYRTKHEHKCRHITLKEMQNYAEKGLLFAIQKYNPKTLSTNFSDFAISYIRHTMCDGIKIH